MSAVASWAAAICIAAIVCAIAEIMIPKGNMDKTLRIVLGAFMICAIAVPLKSTVSAISVDLSKIETGKPDSSRAEMQFIESVINNGKERLKTLAKEELEKINVKPLKIEVIMDTNGDNSISIIEIKIYIGESLKNKRNKIIDCIKNSIGVIPKVYLTGEKNE